MNDKVVSFPGAEPLPENLIQRQDDLRRRMHYCTHGRITLDAHNRLVTCAECGATLDPFQFLLQQADLLQRAWANHRMAAAKVDELNTSIGNLQAEEKRLKGRIRRAKETQPVIDTRGKDRL
jgi:hypothetical protein